MKERRNKNEFGIRVIGLPLHLWDKEAIKAIGDAWWISSSKQATNKLRVYLDEGKTETGVDSDKGEIRMGWLEIN